jgi:hypothetical protein
MKAPGEMTQAQRDFPLPTECEDVFHCGFASEDSFGATSWLVRRPEGNVMMDSPRYHPGLSKRLQVGWLVANNSWVAFGCRAGSKWQ